MEAPRDFLSSSGAVVGRLAPASDGRPATDCLLVAEPSAAREGRPAVELRIAKSKVAGGEGVSLSGGRCGHRKRTAHSVFLETVFTVEVFSTQELAEAFMERFPVDPIVFATED